MEDPTEPEPTIIILKDGVHGLDYGSMVLYPEILDWLADNNVSYDLDTNSSPSWIIFYNPHDAMMFKLTWS